MASPESQSDIVEIRRNDNLTKLAVSWHPRQGLRGKGREVARHWLVFNWTKPILSQIDFANLDDQAGG